MKALGENGCPALHSILSPLFAAKKLGVYIRCPASYGALQNSTVNNPMQMCLFFFIAIIPKMDAVKS